MVKITLGDVLALAWPANLPQLLQMRRAEAIVARVRLFATLFAVLTVAWIAVDAMVLDSARLTALAIARIVSGTMFGILAVSCGIAAPSPRQARARLVALFLVPGAFYLAAQAILTQPPAHSWHEGIASAYSFFPFVLAAGLGAFPLTIAETGVLATLLLAIESMSLAGGGFAGAFGGPEMLWLLLLIAVVSGFAAASQLKLMIALIEQAIRDPLTGCLRRESGAELLEGQFLLAVRQRAPLTVLFADIDRFKAVNDEFGHEAGDRVLAEAADALRAMARESDVLIRWGGEEFVVVLPHTTQTDSVTLIQRLHARGLSTLPDGRPVTVSIGVAEYRGDAAGSMAELVSLADHRMYLAKQAGRNRYVLDASGEAYPIVAPALLGAAPPPAGASSTFSK